MHFFRARENNKGLFYRWLLSYILILLIPIIISGLVSGLSVQIMARQANTANDSMLKLVQQNIDEKILSFQKTAYQISLNTDLVNILSAGEELNNYHQYSAYRLTNQLSNYMISNKHIDGIYFYHIGSDSVISRAGRMKTKYFYSIYFANNRSNGTSYEALLDLLSNEYATAYHKLDINGTSVIALLCSLPIMRTGRPFGTLMITIPETEFQDILDQLRWTDQFGLLVFDESHQIILSNGSRYLSDDVVQEVAVTGSRRASRTYLGETYEFQCISSEATDWMYVVVMPAAVFWEQTTYVRSITLISGFICLLAGGVVAYIFSRRNYAPVNNIVQALTQKKTLSTGKHEREYGFINNAVNENINEIMATYTRLKDQNRALRNSMIANLLKGNPNDDSTHREAVELFRNDLLSPLFAVLVLHIDDCDAFISEGREEHNGAAHKLSMFALSNVIEEMIAEEGSKGYFVELDGALVCVINFKRSHTVDGKNELNHIVIKCQTFCREQIGVSFTAAISNIHGHISNIPLSYREAYDAMEYRKLMEVGGIIHYETIQKQKGNYDYSVQTERMLMNCIKTGDLEATRDLLNMVIHTNLYDAAFSGQLARYLMFSIANTIMKVMYEICDIEFIESTQPIRRLLKCMDIAEMKNEIMSVLETLCRYVGKNEKGHRQLGKAVTEYIGANYMDPNLSTSEISSRFGLTRSYLSVLFKSQTNQTLMDVINKVRLEKAKELLGQSKMSIKDVAVQTGYSNSSVFIRIFRKYEGVTPGEYRESNYTNQGLKKL